MSPMFHELSLPARQRVAALLITDIVASTATAARIGNLRWADLLDAHDERTRWRVEQFGGEVVDFAGDGVFAMFARPVHALACAEAIQDDMRELRLELRAGVHFGEVEIRRRRVSGLAVHVTERIAALARGGETLASRAARVAVATPDAVFIERGAHTLRGVPGSWQLFCVPSASATANGCPSERPAWPTFNPPHSACAA